MTLCLAAFARLALVEGDPERAALLAGAAEGLRQRVGLRTWPMLRRGEAELVAQLRQALGADHFDEVFAAGADSTSGRRWPPPATSAAEARGRPERWPSPAPQRGISFPILASSGSTG